MCFNDYSKENDSSQAEIFQNSRTQKCMTDANSSNTLTNVIKMKRRTN